MKTKALREIIGRTFILVFMMMTCPLVSHAQEWDPEVYGDTNPISITLYSSSPNTNVNYVVNVPYIFNYAFSGVICPYLTNYLYSGSKVTITLNTKLLYTDVGLESSKNSGQFDGYLVYSSMTDPSQAGTGLLYVRFIC